MSAHTNTPQSVCIDPQLAEITPEGISDYYWPLRQSEIPDIAETLVDVWIKTLRAPLSNNCEEARIAFIVSAPLITNFIGAFTACILAARFNKDGKFPILPKNNVAEWRAAFHEEDYQQSRILGILARGVKRPPFFKRILRPLGDLKSKDVFVRRPIEFADLKNGTTAVTICPLVRARKNETQERLMYVPLYEWFYPATEAELRSRPLRPVSEELRETLFSAFEDATGIQLSLCSQALSKGLREIFDTATAWVRFYLERIEAKPEHLPHNLWMGSSGVIWSRILADAVRKNNGHITGHDHALGANYTERTLMPFIEMQVCNRFVTFGDAQADLYQRRGPTQCARTNTPEIISVHTSPQTEGVTPHLSTHTNTPQKILYVTPFLNGSTFSALPLMPITMAIDWQARLFTMLQKMDMQVTQKPHPATPFGIPDTFVENFKTPIRSERFEDIMHEYDILLFDYISQSCFGSALNSSHPIVLVDFGTTKYNDDMLEKLEKRVARVSGWYSDDNRAQVNPDELARAIEKARFLRDTSFKDAISL